MEMQPGQGLAVGRDSAMTLACGRAPRCLCRPWRCAGVPKEKGRDNVNLAAGRRTRCGRSASGRCHAGIRRLGRLLSMRARQACSPVAGRSSVCSACYPPDVASEKHIDVTETLAHLRRMDAERSRKAAERAARFRKSLPRAAEILRACGAKRILLFGSLAEGSPCRESDVDLAVEGLSPDRYFEALGQLMALFRGPVDLVLLEQAGPSLQERVEETGMPL